MDFDIDQYTIFKTLTGSHVYGTALPDSDQDYRGVAVPPKQYFFGYNHHFNQYETSAPEDIVIYDLRKFLKLAADNNPNVLELLFIPQKFWVKSTPEWRRIYMYRDLFLSTKVYHTYRGYAHSQLKRVQSHRAWLLKGEVAEPRREDFGLEPVSKISNEVLGASQELVNLFLRQQDVEDELSSLASQGMKSTAQALRQSLWNFLETTLALTRPDIDDKLFHQAAGLLGFDTNFLVALEKEKLYRRAQREYKSWLNWKAERNEKRRELEAKCGYDSKHVSHTIRLLLTCKELLSTGVMQVERPDAAMLLEIRTGQWSYERVMELADQLFDETEQLYGKSVLPREPKRNEIEALGMDLVEHVLFPPRSIDWNWNP